MKLLWSPIAAAAAGALAWGHFEAGWLRTRVLTCRLPGLPPELAGLRIAHLSDFHLGVPSPGTRAVERAVGWVSERDPDLVCVTGDLLSRPGAESKLRALLERLPRCYAVLGNHDVMASRDPFSRGTRLEELGSARLLSDETVTVDLRGKRVLLAGLDPASRYRRPELAGEADLLILLAHFPEVLDRLPPDRWNLVLAGHMHDGQICVPYAGGKLRLAHPSAKYTNGLYRRGATTMHVSPGLGTSFVPFRFFARPEATELILESE